jgi:putative transcriptional regulator
MAFGYSGWGAGQLEAEIARNDWLIGDASDGLIFGAEPARKWALALAGMGVDAMALSPSGGRA